MFSRSIRRAILEHFLSNLMLWSENSNLLIFNFFLVERCLTSIIGCALSRREFSYVRTIAYSSVKFMLIVFLFLDLVRSPWFRKCIGRIFNFRPPEIVSLTRFDLIKQCVVAIFLGPAPAIARDFQHYDAVGI